MPWGSVLELILWNIFKDDLLQQLLEVSAFAGDCEHSLILYSLAVSLQVVGHLNNKLESIRLWELYYM